MPSSLSMVAIIVVVALGGSSCTDACEQACKDQLDDCDSEPDLPDRPLSCDRQYDYCFAVCTSRPPENHERAER